MSIKTAKDMGDFTWKILVGGDGGVGKTTILHRFLHNEFISDMKMTIGVQFHTQTFERQGKQINLIIWDLGGQDRFRPFLKNYCKGGHGAFALFDMSRMSSLTNIYDWITMFRSVVPQIPIVLVGTKTDLVDENQQSMITELADEIVKKHSLKAFIMTSAKVDYNVTETIHYLVDWLIYEEGKTR